VDLLVCLNTLGFLTELLNAIYTDKQ